MKKFIQSLFLIFFSMLIPAVILIGIFHKYIPAPKITNSYSLNEKIKFLHNKKDLNVDVLTIGSSMALNNVHSGVIMDMLNVDTYVNNAAWGLRIPQVYTFTKLLCEEYTPKKVIFTSNVVDFYKQKVLFNTEDIFDYIKGNSLLGYQLRFFQTDYFFRRLYTNWRNFNTNKTYMSLRFDDFGAILLQKEGFEKNKERWKAEIYFEPVKEDSYDYLDSLALMFYEKGVEFIYVQTPVREGMLNDKDYSKNIIKHIEKTRLILEKYPNVFFVDCTKRVWNDSLYVDTQHFNSEGAEEFSRYFLMKYFNLDKP